MFATRGLLSVCWGTLGLIIGAMVSFTYSPALCAAETVVLASKAGAHLDTNLIKGGGTDDTAVLQHVLDRAASGNPVHLIIDGPSLVTGLNVYGNTTIEFTAGAGLYLKDNSDRAMIRNAHRSRDAVADEHISVRGGFLNGNRDGQRRPSTYPGGKCQEPDGTFKTVLQFLGVNDLTLENMTVWNSRSFGAWIANAKYISIRDVTVDARLPPYPEAASASEERKYWEDILSNTDSIHFNGPVQYATIQDVKLRGDDDSLALNANDMGVDDTTIHNELGPYIGQGPITDIVISNVVFTDTYLGMRFLSSNQRIDRVVVSNIVGTVRQRMAVLGTYGSPSHGNFGSIIFDNINVQPAKARPLGELFPEWKKSPIFFAEEGERALFSLNGAIDTLRLHHVTVEAIDDRPIVLVGPAAHVQVLNADLILHDALLQGIPFDLESGGGIERLDAALVWKGTVTDEGRNPIRTVGGTIGQVNWVGTPPLYVEAHAVAENASSLDVVFNEKLKAALSGSGAKITVEGRQVAIVGTTLQPDGMTVRYRLASPFNSRDKVTWSYEAREGEVQNLSGTALSSVSEKTVRAVN